MAFLLPYLRSAPIQKMNNVFFYSTYEFSTALQKLIIKINKYLIFKRIYIYIFFLLKRIVPHQKVYIC